MLADVFKFDSQYLENEERYKSIKAEILGEDSDDESGSGSDEDDSEEEEGNKICLSISFHLVNLFLFDLQLQRRKKASRTGLKRTWSIYVVSSI